MGNYQWQESKRTSLKLDFLPPAGFADLQGQMAISPVFYSADSFNDGLCLVTTEDSIGYINRLGEFVWQ